MKIQKVEETQSIFSMISDEKAKSYNIQHMCWSSMKDSFHEIPPVGFCNLTTWEDEWRLRKKSWRGQMNGNNKIEGGEIRSKSESAMNGDKSVLAIKQPPKQKLENIQTNKFQSWRCNLLETQAKENLWMKKTGKVFSCNDKKFIRNTISDACSKLCHQKNLTKRS